MRHLLVVDGDPTAGDVIHDHLGRLYRVTHALTKREAWEVMRRQAVHLVLLESRLPDDSGLNLLAQIGRHHPELPVVIVTAYGSEAVCAAVFRLGAADYIAKPVDPALLLGVSARIAAAGSRAPSGGTGRPLPRLARPVSPPTRDEQRIGEAVRFIQGHYADRIALAEVARSCRMGRFSLSHAFHLVMHVTFRTYLQRLRVTRATELLGQTSHSITEIADMVGFGDLSRFNKAFKKHLGLPPTAYRKRVTQRAEGSAAAQGGVALALIPDADAEQPAKVTRAP
jgi:two-component system, response regulator YesN